MNNPPHPGEVINEVCLKPLRMSIEEGALRLGVSTKHLSDVIRGRKDISFKFAKKLAKVFNTSGKSWLDQQMHYNNWKSISTKSQGDIK